MGKKLTTEDFIEKAKAVHGDRYDYSKVEYVSTHMKVIIICPKHGEFHKAPAEHVGKSKQGCPICAENNRIVGSKLGVDAFIKKGIKMHGNKYNYSKVEYVNSKTHVTIICPEHGEFLQAPSNHIHKTNKRGCPKCAGNVKLTTEEFIKKAQKIHQNKYNYLKTKYVNAHTKVIIVCPKHGEFQQTPSDHKSGKGCKSCANKNSGNSQRLTVEDFIHEAKKIHSDKYDYSKAIYVNYNTPLEIVCPEHDSFFQSPASHLHNNGCPKCGGRYKTTEDFIRKAREVHGDKYDYSKAEYVNAHKKVIIICPEHSEFQQTASSHLMGNGCQICAGNYKHSLEDFIQKVQKVHGNKYDYSRVEYVNTHTKVIIICPEHGEFQQTPSDHKSGKGCIRCQGRGFNYLPFNEAKKIIAKHKFKTEQEYAEWWQLNKEYCQNIGLPRNADQYYRNHQ